MMKMLFVRLVLTDLNRKGLHRYVVDLLWTGLLTEPTVAFVLVIYTHEWRTLCNSHNNS